MKLFEIFSFVYRFYLSQLLLFFFFFYYFTHYKYTQDRFHTYIYFFIKKTLMSTDAFYLYVCQ